MNISDIVYKTVAEVDAMPRFDLVSPPKIGKWYLQPVAWLLSFPETWKHHVKIRKHRMEHLKGGYLLMCNHNAFFDFKVATRAFFPRRANYVVAVDGFINREKIMRDVGCIAKRKFITDIQIVRQIKTSINDHQQICALYPEARYSLVGTTAVLPDSLGKLIKLLGAPVVTFICHGHHLQQPVWNLKKRLVPTSADMTQLLTVEEVIALSVEDINTKLREAFYYDDYAYQLEQRIEIHAADRAEGLHKPLYQCPNCLVEGKMNSKGHELFCEACQKRWSMDTFGRLSANEGKTEFSHIPDWFEWIRLQVRQQVQTGTYHIDVEVDVDSLPNSTGFYRLGRARLIHNHEGFQLSAMWNEKPFEVKKAVADNYSVHIEYDYFGKGHAVSFSLPNDTYYCFPVDRQFPITKFHFGTEELYRHYIQKKD